jgi:hypothetical protein
MRALLAHAEPTGGLKESGRGHVGHGNLVVELGGDRDAKHGIQEQRR